MTELVTAAEEGRQGVLGAKEMLRILARAHT
jgi:hypothetical protein